MMQAEGAVVLVHSPRAAAVFARCWTRPISTAPLSPSPRSALLRPKQLATVGRVSMSQSSRPMTRCWPLRNGCATNPRHERPPDPDELECAAADRARADPRGRGRRRLDACALPTRGALPRHCPRCTSAAHTQAHRADDSRRSSTARTPIAGSENASHRTARRTAVARRECDRSARRALPAVPMLWSSPSPRAGRSIAESLSAISRTFSSTASARSTSKRSARSLPLRTSRFGSTTSSHNMRRSAPDLRRGGPQDSWWTNFRRGLGSLVEVRRADRPSTNPDARYSRALQRLSSGDVDQALAETMRLPGAANATDWVDKARRYVAAHRALDEIESAALLTGPANRLNVLETAWQASRRMRFWPLRRTARFSCPAKYLVTGANVAGDDEVMTSWRRLGLRSLARRGADHGLGVNAAKHFARGLQTGCAAPRPRTGSRRNISATASRSSAAASTAASALRSNRSTTAGATGWKADELYPQQSVSKLWVSITALDAVDKGRVRLDDKVTLDPRRPHRCSISRSPRLILERRLHDHARRPDVQGDHHQRQHRERQIDALGRRAGGSARHDQRQAFGRDPLLQRRARAPEQDRRTDLEPGYSIGNAFFDARDALPSAVRKAAFDRYVDDPYDGAAPSAIVSALARLKRGELLSPSSTEHLLTDHEQYQDRREPAERRARSPAGCSTTRPAPARCWAPSRRAITILAFSRRRTVEAMPSR